MSIITFNFKEVGSLPWGVSLHTQYSRHEGPAYYPRYSAQSARSLCPFSKQRSLLFGLPRLFYHRRNSNLWCLQSGMTTIIWLKWWVYMLPVDLIPISSKPKRWSRPTIPHWPLSLLAFRVLWLPQHRRRVQLSGFSVFRMGLDSTSSAVVSNDAPLSTVWHSALIRTTWPPHPIRKRSTSSD